MKTYIMWLMMSVVTASVFLTGCQDKNESGETMSPTNDSTKMSNMGQTVGSNLDHAVNSVSNGTRNLLNGATNENNAQVDNSKINERDRDTNNLTPLDQGNSDADRMISSNIRKMVVSGTNSYSMLAKNVKIITRQGKVTLRGPVKTEDEKSGIESIAKSVAGAENVDNQLEVKNN